MVTAGGWTHETGRRHLRHDNRANDYSAQHLPGSTRECAEFFNRWSRIVGLESKIVRYCLNFRICPMSGRVASAHPVLEGGGDEVHGGAGQGG